MQVDEMLQAKSHALSYSNKAKKTHSCWYRYFSVSARKLGTVSSHLW